MSGHPSSTGLVAGAAGVGGAAVVGRIQLVDVDAAVLAGGCTVEIVGLVVEGAAVVGLAVGGTGIGTGEGVDAGTSAASALGTAAPAPAVGPPATMS